MNKGITHKELLKLHGATVVVKYYGEIQTGIISVNKGERLKERVYFCSDEWLRNRAPSLEVIEDFGMKYARALSWNTPCGKIEDNYGRTIFIKVIEEIKVNKRKELLDSIKESNLLIEQANNNIDRAIEALKELPEGFPVTTSIFDGDTKFSLLFNSDRQRLGCRNGLYTVSTFKTKGMYLDSREEFLWIKYDTSDMKSGDVILVGNPEKCYQSSNVFIVLEGELVTYDSGNGIIVSKASHICNQEVYALARK